MILHIFLRICSESDVQILPAGLWRRKKDFNLCSEQTYYQLQVITIRFTGKKKENYYGS